MNIHGAEIANLLMVAGTSRKAWTATETNPPAVNAFTVSELQGVFYSYYQDELIVGRNPWKLGRKLM